VLKSKAKVTEVEIKEFFEENKFDINVKKFFLAEIFIPKLENTKELAEKLVLELRNGADFNAIVQQFSRGLNVENNGELGWLASSDLDKKIYNILLKVNKGGYSDAIALADGFHIFKVLDVKTETHIAARDMDAARNAIFAKKLQSLAKGYLLDLRKKSFIELSN
jgi:peptidyl-prolyl cis-trans isomerase SurA